MTLKRCLQFQLETDDVLKSANNCDLRRPSNDLGALTFSPPLHPDYWLTYRSSKLSELPGRCQSAFSRCATTNDVIDDECVQPEIEVAEADIGSLPRQPLWANFAIVAQCLDNKNHPFSACISPCHINFYRASICEGGLGSRNAVCPSVRLSHAWIVTKLNTALQIFWYHTKGQLLCYFDTNSGWWATLLASEINGAINETWHFTR